MKKRNSIRRVYHPKTQICTLIDTTSCQNQLDTILKLWKEVQIDFPTLPENKVYMTIYQGIFWAMEFPCPQTPSAKNVVEEKYETLNAHITSPEFFSTLFQKTKKE